MYIYKQAPYVSFPENYGNNELMVTSCETQQCHKDSLFVQWRLEQKGRRQEVQLHISNRGDVGVQNFNFAPEFSQNG